MLPGHEFDVERPADCHAGHACVPALFEAAVLSVSNVFWPTATHATPARFYDGHHPPAQNAGQRPPLVPPPMTISHEGVGSLVSAPAPHAPPIQSHSVATMQQELLKACPFSFGSFARDVAAVQILKHLHGTGCCDALPCCCTASDEKSVSGWAADSPDHVLVQAPLRPGFQGALCHGTSDPPWGVNFRHPWILFFFNC